MTADAITNHALNAAAWLALRVLPPLRAKSVIDRIARAAQPFPSEDDARAAAHALGWAGTCLSRCLAVASRLPGSDVLIGIDPSCSGRFRAHAWIEVHGRPLEHLRDDRAFLPIAHLGAKFAK